MSENTKHKRISEREYEYVRQVLDGSFRGSYGAPMTKRLEELFARKFQSDFAISFCNGTATMHAILAAAGIGPGDEVIVPPLTMSSTSFAVVHAGATPVWADVDPHTFTLDPESVSARVTSRTKAMIPVALYGQPPDMSRLMRLADSHDLFVLEDAAQCFLGYADDKVIGSIGHAGSFSFQSSKHMTCGEGGIVTTRDSALATKIRQFGSLGYGAVGAAAGKSKISKEDIQDPDYERHVSVGFNYRMAELCSAVALGQLERIEELVAMRQAVARFYAEALAESSCLTPQSSPSGTVNSQWAYALSLDTERVDWREFRKKYIELGGKPFYAAWKLSYQEPAFQEFAARERAAGRAVDCAVAERLQRSLIQLKTNYTDLEEARLQADILRRTIKLLER